MRNEMNRENMMSACRYAVSSLAGVDNRTMKDVAEMSLRSRGAGVEVRNDIVGSLFCERSAAAEDYSF